MKKKKIIISTAVIAIITLLAIYTVRIIGATSFPEGSVLNGIDIGGKTAEEAEKSLAEAANKIDVKCDDADPVRVNAEFTYSGHHLERLIRMAAANPFVARKLKLGEYGVQMKVEGGTEETAKVLNKSKISAEDVESKDAYIDFETMEIVKEFYGNKLDYEKLAGDIAVYVEQGKEDKEFAFKSTEYVKPPKVFSTDESILNEFKFYQKYIGEGITLTYPDGTTAQISPKELSEVVKCKNGEPEFNEAEAGKLAEKYINYKPSSANVKTLDGDKELPNYVLSVPADKEKLKEGILDALKEFKREIKVVPGESASLPSTRVEISLTNQTCTYVQEGKKKFRCNIVSGTSGHRTPVGIFEVAYKDRNVTLKGNNDDGSKYESPVTYWMPFNGGIGMHDASWRSSFGGSIYVNNGSHGCINMPIKYAKKMYQKVDAGTVVVVYE